MTGREEEPERNTRWSDLLGPDETGEHPLLESRLNLLSKAARRAAKREQKSLDEPRIAALRGKVFGAISRQLSDDRIGAHRKAPRWTRWALPLAASVAGVVVGTLFVGQYPGLRTHSTAPELVLRYGDEQVSRDLHGATHVVRIMTASPQDMVDTAARILLENHIPFAIYRLGSKGARAVVFTSSESVPPTIQFLVHPSGQVLRPRTSYDIRFTPSG